MKKYYVEINMEDVDVENYLAQSGWKDSVEECLEWANKLFQFFYVNFDYQGFTDRMIMEIMCAECEYTNEEENYFEYGDIDSYCKIYYDYRKHKVVSEQEFRKKEMPF